ncbi:MAG: hypothetical protein ACMG57_03620, partial [Candidatus Dojkabacteria bacterium]
AYGEYFYECVEEWNRDLEWALIRYGVQPKTFRMKELSLIYNHPEILGSRELYGENIEKF